MSVIVLSDKHISAIVRFGFGPSWAEEDFRPRLQSTADRLREENILAYNKRYAENFPVLPCEIDYTAPEPTPIQALKLMQAYDDNCGELGTYHVDTAAEHIRGFRDKAITRIQGYDSAPWDI